MQRPPHLPDFGAPPLDEVVVGVQFNPIPGYNAVFAQGIWDLFHSKFPSVQELPLLQPQFETFGGANQQASFQFQFGAAVGSRLWFISGDQNRLMQFQSDRFLANWRRSPNSQPYPRFEVIVESFEKSLATLVHHVRECFNFELEINQAEVTYINIIPVESFSDAGKWFNLWSEGEFNIESLSHNFTEIIHDLVGKPVARLHHEIQSANTVDGGRSVFSLNLTYRGKPKETDAVSAIQFLGQGREAIVSRFTSMTTAFAHEKWRRMK